MPRSLSGPLALLLLPACLTAAAPAPPGVLDVIPRESSAALVLRSVHDFKTKGKKLLDDIDVKMDMTPEKIVQELYKLLHIEGGVDEKAPVVLTILLAEGGGMAGIDDVALLLPI